MNQTLIRIIVLCGFCFLLFSQNAISQEKKSQSLTLTNGQFEAQATYKFSDQGVPISDLGGTVTVTVKGNKLSIIIPISKQPITAKLTGNTFKGRFLGNGVSVEFQGEIVENNHTEGVFFGNFGQKKVIGLWTMKVSKKKQEQEKGT
jgi:hypothetical protein